MKRFLPIAVLLIAAAALAAEPLQREHDLRLAMRMRGEALGCPPTFVRPPVTVYSAIAESTCVNTIDLRSEVFSVHVREGEILDVDFASPEFEVFLFMYLGDGRSGPDRRASWLTSGTSRVTMRYVAQETRTYEIQAMHLLPLDWEGSKTGRYTLKINVAGASGCTPPTAFAPVDIDHTRITPRLLATDPLKLEWFRDDIATFTGWPFLAPSPGTWSYRATNACGTSVDSVRIGPPSRRRSAAPV